MKSTSTTRARELAIFFLLVGLGIAIAAAARLDPDQVSTMGLGKSGRFDISTQSSLILMGAVLVVASGVSLLRRSEPLVAPLLILDTVVAILALLTAAASGRSIDLVGLMASSLRLCTPIALGSMAGIFCERSGVINIAIEGMMLAGAAFGFGFFLLTKNIWLGVGMAMLVGATMSSLHALLSIRFKTDQIISGTVINILAVGASGFLRRAYLINAFFVGEVLPLIKVPVLSDIPVVGPIFFQQRPTIYAMMILVILTHVMLFYTPWGLRTRAVGEHPRAADTVGINVNRMRYINVFISGLIAGIGGAWFSLETVGSFEDLMTNGKGFIALAAMIFGKWTPFGAFLGAFLFGFADALQIKLQILDVAVPSQFLLMAPYIVTIVVLTGIIGRATPPAAIGQPYEKQ